MTDLLRARWKAAIKRAEAQSWQSLGVAACAVIGTLALASAAFAQRLIVLVSSDTAPYEQAVAGIQTLGVPVETVRVAAQQEPAAATLARAGRDSGVIALGAPASMVAARAAPSMAVVNCMMPYSDEARSPASVTVPAEVPIETQLQWLKRLLPEAHSVGILFDPAQNERRAADDAAALKRAGYLPVLEPVTGPTVLPHALVSLASRIDVLHALPDSTVYSREHSRALLLFSFRRHVPIAGPTEAWVKAGALYSLDWDYTDLGRYCAALALRQLAGGKGAVPAPPRTRAFANARSAEQLGITWDAETMKSFDRVYE